MRRDGVGVAADNMSAPDRAREGEAQWQLKARELCAPLQPRQSHLGMLSGESAGTCALENGEEQRDTAGVSSSDDC